MNSRVLVSAAWSLIASLVLCAAASAAPLLLRNPSLSQDRIAFLYGGDIWTVSRQGGEARRLTSVGAVSEGPYFSPDGSQVAYSAREHGNTDVYVASSEGGVPHRLTWDPTGSLVTGWTPDGKDVLFTSGRASKSVFPRLFKIRADGVGPAEALPLPSVDWGSLSSDGSTLAYVPVRQWQPAWKHYRGGQTKQIWLVNMKTLDLEKIPRENSNDSSPVWVGSTVYFLSDRNGSVSLFDYDTKTKQVQQVLDNHGLDLKTVGAGPGGAGVRAVWIAASLRSKFASGSRGLGVDPRRTSRSATASCGRPSRGGREYRGIAQRRARRGRSARRHFHAARGERRHPQSDQYAG